MMSPPDATCVLVAELTGAEALADKLGVREAERAIERGRARAARAVDAYAGQTLVTEGRRLAVAFPRCDNAVLAANDMRERISQLPPVSGISLALRIGLHAGPADAASTTMAYASQLEAAAQRDQVLISAEAVELLGEPVRSQIGGQQALSIEGKAVFEIRGEMSGLRASQYNGNFFTRSQTQFSDLVANGDDSLPPPLVGDTPRTRLMLRHQSASYIVSQTHAVLLAGREEGNDLVIADRRASRHHARIEFRNGTYMLIDTSTNGTYLVDDHGLEVILKRSECPLPERGRIGFGYSPQEIGVEAALFDIGSK